MSELITGISEVGVRPRFSGANCVFRPGICIDKKHNPVGMNYVFAKQLEESGSGIEVFGYWEACAEIKRIRKKGASTSTTSRRGSACTTKNCFILKQ